MVMISSKPLMCIFAFLLQVGFGCNIGQHFIFADGLTQVTLGVCGISLLKSVDIRI